VPYGDAGCGQERGLSQAERQRQQSRDRMEDVNESTRPNQVNLADLKKRKA
jgi:hypothetical protein